MNEQRIVDDCLRLSCRQAQIKGISQRTWQHVRKTGEMPEDRRGRPEDLQLRTCN